MAAGSGGGRSSAGEPASEACGASSLTMRPVTNYAEARRSDTARYARFFHAMLERGVYLAPSQFESAFVSSSHDEQVSAQTLAAAADALAAVAADGEGVKGTDGRLRCGAGGVIWRSGRHGRRHAVSRPCPAGQERAGWNVRRRWPTTTPCLAE